MNIIDKLKKYFQDLINEEPEKVTLDKIKQIKHPVNQPLRIRHLSVRK